MLNRNVSLVVCAWLALSVAALGDPGSAFLAQLPGPNSAGEMAHIQNHTARRVADLGVELIVVDPESIRPALEAVSSSEIRELLAAGDLERLRARRWLHPEVLAALASERR